MSLISASSGLPVWRRGVKKPALAWRVAHVDLKGPMIPAKVMPELLRLYGRWGLNGVLVEYEHRLPSLPLDEQFPAADRYTPQQLKAWIGMARELGIEWIPLVQMFGHQEYLSRLPDTSGLMENPQMPNQLCPSRPAVLDYLRRLLDVVCEYHPGGKYIHAGMDETLWLGHCPACRKRALKLGGKLELYMDHALWVCEEIRKRGRVPMLWGDMILGHGRPDLLKMLDKDVIVAPWDYGSKEPRMNHFTYKGGRVARHLFRMRYCASDLGRLLPGLPGKGGFTDELTAADKRNIGGFDAADGSVPAFPQLTAMIGKVRKPWCAGGAQMSADGQLHTNYVRGLLNANQLVRSLLEAKGEGGIITAWARGHSWAPINAPWPLALYAMAQFAASAWSGRTSLRDLQARQAVIAAELGMPAKLGDWTLDDVLGMLSRPLGAPLARGATVRRILGLLKEKPPRSVFGECLMLALELEVAQCDLLFLIEEIRWWHSNAKDLPPEVTREMDARFKAVRKQIASRRAKARTWYLRWVGEAAAFDVWWKGLFGSLDGFIEHGLSGLRQAGQGKKAKNMLNKQNKRG